MNMREKIARAIYEKRNGHGCTPWRVQSGNHRVPYLLDADAALDALMEPTEEMLDAVPASHSVSFQAIWPKICGDVFTAMIQAAKEGK